MGVIRNILERVTTMDMLMKLICAICISTMVILIIICCTGETKNSAPADGKENSTPSLANGIEECGTILFNN